MAAMGPAPAKEADERDDAGGVHSMAVRRPVLPLVRMDGAGRVSGSSPGIMWVEGQREDDSIGRRDGEEDSVSVMQVAEPEGSVLDERNGHADSQADELQGGAARLYLGELWAVEGEPRADALDALRLWAEDLGRSGLSVSEGSALDGPTSTPEPAAVEPGPRDDTTAATEFRQGYRDASGPSDLEEHFVRNVLPCESGVRVDGNIDWTPGNSDYRSAAQFHPQSWERIEREVGRALAFEDPYDVGLAVATWVRLIGPENIATNGGWPVCGKR